MKQLPEIARQRLAAPGARPAGSVSRTDAAPHLDANLVSAFVERSLFPAERTRVLDHLAACSDCRAEVRVVLRAAAPDPDAARIVPADSAVSHPWWGWMIRWETTTAGAAAVLALAAFWVSTRPAPHPAPNAPVMIARSTAPAPSAIAGSPNVPAELPASPPAQSVQFRLQTEAQAKHGAAKKAATNDAARTTLSNALAHLDQPPAGAPTDLAKPSVTAALPPAQQASPVSSAVAAPPPPAPAAAFTSAKSSALSVEPETVYLQAGAAPSASASSARMKAVPAPRLMNVRPTMVGSVRPEARWAASAAAPPGTIKKSSDDGRTWQSVVVADGVQLHAVFPLGNDVWAGGAAGAFFHSTDGGQHWSAIPVSGSGKTLSSDIVSIQFADPTHGSITAANGERWTTSDGGAHWQQGN